MQQKNIDIKETGSDNLIRVVAFLVKNVLWFFLCSVLNLVMYLRFTTAP